MGYGFQGQGQTVATLLNNVYAACADLMISAHYGGDLATSRVSSAVIQQRHQTFLRRTTLNQEARARFEEVVLADHRAVAEIIDSGERSFDEFLKVLDRAPKFKNWLTSANPDEDLVRKYEQEISREPWISSVPARVARFMIAMSAEHLHPAAGAATAFADLMFAEKWFAGWRPNHFVHHLGEFTRRD
jgi:hypothetical protein